jgi:hypothetical protein
VAVKNKKTGKIAVVLINTSSSPVTETVRGLTSTKVDLYRTSATENMKMVSSHDVSGGVVTVTLPQQSVTTLVDYQVTTGIRSKLSSRPKLSINPIPSGDVHYFDLKGAMLPGQNQNRIEPFALKVSEFQSTITKLHTR